MGRQVWRPIAVLFAAWAFGRGAERFFRAFLTLVAFLTAKISTGREDKPTPPGNYLVTDKIKLELSTLYKVRMPYFLRLSFSEYGIHYGYNPGHPASDVDDAAGLIARAVLIPVYGH